MSNTDPLPNDLASFPTVHQVRWPVVQALRKLGEPARVVEIADRVADAFDLTPQQRSETVPTGQVRIENRVMWAAYRLKEIGVLHYPEPGLRGLTALGHEVDEQQIDELWAEHQSSRRAPMDEEKARPAWVVRDGGRFDYNVEHGVAALDYNSADGHPDLRSLESRDEVQQMMRDTEPASSDQKIAVQAGQLWRFRTEPLTGDVIVMPRKGTTDLAVGTIRETYWYADAEDQFRHRLSVDWNRTDVPRTGLGADLRRSLRSALAFYSITKHDCSERLQQFMETGEDPGPLVDPDEESDDLVRLVNQPGPNERLMPPMGDLADLSDELLVEAGFLKDIVSLLEDKGQVILYGPPGTGKTYLARKLAKVLAPDESRRALVQFHPSTSYEDFFEGYRPKGTDTDGGIHYKLTPGPLARMAEKAEATPSEPHVMIIDEINRANLPRVLGELLFLLEYRDESVQTLYRPEPPFSLPGNLWFIGTMNTADRSIALVDAALRRRFHFVPFFPDSGPMARLLAWWLDRHREPAWVARLVGAVNKELTDALGGSDLLLGPSHFMKKYGPTPDSQREQLRRIWEYNIEPFIEDQFFGDPKQIQRFRFAAVMDRHGPESAARRSEATGRDADAGARPDGSESSDADTAS